MTDRFEEFFEKAVDTVEEDRARRCELSWRQMLESRAGRAVIFDLFGICHFGMSPFAGDTNTTMMIAGKQKVGEYLKDMINKVFPDSYQLMIQEAKEDEDYDRDQHAKRNNADSDNDSQP